MTQEKKDLMGRRSLLYNFTGSWLNFHIFDKCGPTPSYVLFMTAPLVEKSVSADADNFLMALLPSVTFGTFEVSLFIDHNIP